MAQFRGKVLEAGGGDDTMKPTVEAGDGVNNSFQVQAGGNEEVNVE